MIKSKLPKWFASSAGSFESFAKKLASGPYSIERTASSVKPVLGQRRNVLVTEDLKVRMRKASRNDLERWQSENEIANCAAADHQNPVHSFTDAALCERRIHSTGDHGPPLQIANTA